MEKVVEQEGVEKKKAPTQAELIAKAIGKLESDDFTIHFYCPSLNQPSGGIGVLLRIAAAYQKKGYKVKIWYEPQVNQEASVQASQQAKKETVIFDKFNPTWVDFDISKLSFLPLGASEDGKIPLVTGEIIDAFPLQVAAEDFMFIPEGFPNIMERTMGLSCKRIVMAQSWLYILAGLKNGQIWQNFGIKDVLSVSNFISEYVNSIMPGLSIKSLKQGINRDIFYKPEGMSSKMPIIGYQNGRGPESQLKVLTAIKMFYAANPHMRWWRFMELNGMSREEFAERLRDCAFVLYTDEVAGFGTLPLEAMACGTHVVGYAAPGGQEYTTAENGFWANNGNVFELAELLGIATDKWVSGEMDVDNIQEEYETTLTNYTVEGEAERVIEIIDEYKKERIDELKGAQKK